MAHLHVFVNTGQQLLQLIRPDDLPSVEAHLQLAFDGRIPVVLHCVIRPVAINTIASGPSYTVRANSELGDVGQLFTSQEAAWRSLPSGFPACSGPCR